MNSLGFEKVNLVKDYCLAKNYGSFLQSLFSKYNPLTKALD